MTNQFEWKKYNLENDCIVYKIIKDKNYYLTYDNFYNSIMASPKLLHDIVSILKSCPFESYYLEFTPVCLSFFAETLFEFVIVKTDQFVNKTDILTFGESNINTNSNNIYTFPNLSKKSILLSPR